MSANLETRRSMNRDWRRSSPQRGEPSMHTVGVFLVVAAIGIGGAAGARVFGLPLSLTLSTGFLWVSMLVAATYIALTARSPGLFAVRGSDIIWGVGGALIFRWVSGWVSGANSSSFPASALAHENAPTYVFAQAVLFPGFIGPIIEEVFFHATLLPIVYKFSRTAAGSLAAGVAAALASTGAFVLVHAVFAPLSLSDALQLAALGVVCAGLVLLTGRIWGAVILHMTYNGVYVALALAGVWLS